MCLSCVCLLTIACQELKQTVRNIEWEEGISNDTEGLLPEVGNVHLKLTDKDFETIFMSLDDVHMGKLHFEQFLQAIRGPLSPDRMLLVDLAFEKLGTCTHDRLFLCLRYSPRFTHPPIIIHLS